MKTDYELLKSPAFWRPLGCKLEGIEKQGELEIARVTDLFCGDSFILIIKLHTVNDVYKMLQQRRKENLQ